MDHHTWRECNQCGKRLATYKTLWRHRKTCKRQLKTYKGKGISPSEKKWNFTHSSVEEDDYPSQQNLPAAFSNGINKDDSQSVVTIDRRSKIKDDGSNELDIAKYTWNDPGYVERAHSFLLPKKSIRAIVVGKSGFGKSTLLNYLLLHPGMLDYDTLTVCGQSLHQPEYRIIKRAFEKGLSKNQVNALFRNQNKLNAGEDPEDFIDCYEGSCKGGVEATFIDNFDGIPDPSEHDPARKNLLIFDDVMLGPQNKCEAYYTRGRHNNVDVFYIAQSYFRLPRQTVRENANLFILFKQDNTNLSHIYRDHCSVDGIPFEAFKNFCTDVWRRDKHNFVTLDTSRPAEGGKYRRNLNDYWVYREGQTEEE